MSEDREHDGGQGCSHDQNVCEGSSRQEMDKGVKRYPILESQGFIVGRTLGHGSYGCVKSAYDVKKKHKVAVKIISKLKASVDYLNKFLPREISIIRAMVNPSLIQFYQVIETTKRFFLVMELSDNGDLLEHIETNNYIDERQAGKWMKNLVDGVSYIHDLGVCHRDIKCENLLINRAMHLKITDFGFAKKMEKGKGNPIVLSSTFCGSYAYAPPEILTGTPYNPFISEVWSMGVVLFTTVFGRFPFDDSNHGRLIKQVQAKIGFPSKPVVSENCRILIVKMLCKAPDRMPLSNIRYDAWFKDYDVDAWSPDREGEMSESRTSVPPPVSGDSGRASVASSSAAGPSERAVHVTMPHPEDDVEGSPYRQIANMVDVPNVYKTEEEYIHIQPRNTLQLLVAIVLPIHVYRCCDGLVHT